MMLWYTLHHSLVAVVAIHVLVGLVEPEAVISNPAILRTPFHVSPPNISGGRVSVDVDGGEHSAPSLDNRLVLVDRG